MMQQVRETKKADALAELAIVFEYPNAEYKTSIAKWMEKHALDFPNAVDAIKKFAHEIENFQTENLEEAYTRTFDMAPICSPYISGHIYGEENFQRGTLLTALNDRYNEAFFSTRGELPDHIALIMRFAPHMSDEELDELCEYCLSNPLDEMVKSLSGNPYEHAVSAIRQLVHVDGVSK